VAERTPAERLTAQLPRVLDWCAQQYHYPDWAAAQTNRRKRASDARRLAMQAVRVVWPVLSAADVADLMGCATSTVYYYWAERESPLLAEAARKWGHK